ncbi:hypothetical protein CLOM_g21109 [Closterium sp. NIES-68]|nr:hypothetical protein CLOM_g21109 [Closterium sp. NIES-68]GJP73128.1 hypothetical protein CLOP_g3871 [Closterium sp. NIES-67]
MAADYLTKKLMKAKFQYCMLLIGLQHLVKQQRSRFGVTCSSREMGEHLHGQVDRDTGEFLELGNSWAETDNI